MLALLFASLLTILPAPVDSTQALYAHGRADALARHCAAAETERDDLLCRYRLYPLTEDASLLADLPDAPRTVTAETAALLSGLWGYRAARSSMVGMMRHGLRSQKLLDRALAADADHPFALLVAGQASLFKPAFAGGSAERALAHFEELERRLSEAPYEPISVLEARVWRWLALDVLGRPEAGSMRAALLSEDLPPLYREFVLDPPRP